jgi:serine/threonine-protein kinase
VTDSLNGHNATTISPNGQRLVIQEGGDIKVVTLDQERRVEAVAQPASDERHAEISPDGRWLAYESNESGRYEVYVRPFPDVNGGKWPISTDGGTRPAWAKNVRELFYVAESGAMMAVPIEAGSTWAAGAPIKLFDWPVPISTTRSYDVSKDGRFLMLKTIDVSEQDASPSGLVVVQHFDEELKRLVPAK